MGSADGAILTEVWSEEGEGGIRGYEEMYENGRSLRQVKMRGNYLGFYLSRDVRSRDGREHPTLFLSTEVFPLGRPRHRPKTQLIVSKKSQSVDILDILDI